MEPLDPDVKPIPDNDTDTDHGIHPAPDGNEDGIHPVPDDNSNDIPEDEDDKVHLDQIDQSVQHMQEG